MKPIVSFAVFGLIFLVTFGLNPVRGHDHNSSHEGSRSALLRDSAYQWPSDKAGVKVTDIRKIVEGDFLAPRFSANGEFLILTGGKYRGLWTVQPDGTDLRRVSYGHMAGWRPLTIVDDKIIYRTADFDQTGNIIYTIRQYDIHSKRHETIYHAVNEDVYPPRLTRDGSRLIILTDRGVLSKTRDGRIQTMSPEQADENIVFSDGGRVWRLKLGETHRREVSGGRETCGGEQLSPCGRYVAYLSGNTNSIIIVDLQADTEVDVGEGSNLAWAPDSSLLLYSVTGDDGHSITEADLFIINPDGTGRQRLTFDPNIGFYNASWSSDGKRIVCEDTFTGNIYLLEISSLQETGEKE